MKVKELIEKLSALPADLDVVVEADHGQTPMSATWVGEMHVQDKSEYMMEAIADEDLGEYPDADKVVVIQGY